MCVRACVCACVCVCVRACIHVCMCACVKQIIFTHPESLPLGELLSQQCPGGEGAVCGLAEKEGEVMVTMAVG